MDMDAARIKVEGVIETVIGRFGGDDTPTDEFLISVIQSCIEAEISRADSELFLQDRFGIDPQFTEFFDNAWTECQGSITGLLRSESDCLLSQTPVLMEAVYRDLPKLLKTGVSSFDDQRQKDVFLIGALGVLGSVLTKVEGIYGGEVVNPVLYMLILAPAASGKSALKQSASLVRKVHDEIKERSEEEFRQYQIEKRAYDRKLRSESNDPGDPPVEPRMKVHFIPANSSRASIISMLSSNSGKGLMFDTEADSLSKMFASEWGDFSELIRKGFHHELISSSRKTNGEYIEIDRPCFSIVLTGTPGQAVNLVQSAENGMFSRLGFYAFSSPLEWISPAPKPGQRTFNEIFDELGTEVLSLYRKFQSSTFSFELQSVHWEKFNQNFADKLGIITAIHGNEASSVVKRLGLICYRIAMILSAIKHFEAQMNSTRILCSHETFSTALSISNTLLEHSLLVFDKLPKSNSSSFSMSDPNEDFFNELPHQFSRQDAFNLAKEKQLGRKRKIDGLLAKWTNKGRLEKPMPGKYVKANAVC